MKDTDKLVKGAIIMLLAMALVVLALIFTSCNYQVVDLTYEYNYAYIQLQNGEVVEGHVSSWKDYEGEQLQVTIDGVTYLTSSYNCTLVRY